MIQWMDSRVILDSGGWLRVQRMQDEGDLTPSGGAARDQVGHPKVSQMVPDVSFQTAEFHPSITPAAPSRHNPVITAWPQRRRALPALSV